MAHRVIPVEDLESFYVLKEKGLTGRQLLKLQLADYVPHSMKHQAGSSEEEEGEGEGKMEIGNGTGEVGEVQEDEANLSEDAKMCRDLLRAIRQAKVGVVTMWVGVVTMWVGVVNMVHQTPLTRCLILHCRQPVEGSSVQPFNRSPRPG